MEKGSVSPPTPVPGTTQSQVQRRSNLRRLLVAMGCAALVCAAGGFGEAFYAAKPELHGSPNNQWIPLGLMLFPLVAGFVAAAVAGQRERLVALVVGLILTPVAVVWFILVNSDWSSPFVDWNIARLLSAIPVAWLGGQLRWLQKRRRVAIR